MSRVACAAIAVAALALAGCTASPAIGPVATIDDACAWGACAADVSAWPDWSVPEEATAALTFDAPYTAAGGLARIAGGWAWTARRGDVAVVELYAGEPPALRSYALPPSATVGRDALAFDGRDLWFTQHTARVPGASGADELVRWRLADDDVAYWPLGGVPGTPWVKSVGAAVLVRSDRVADGTVAWVFDTALGSLAAVVGDGGTSDAALDGALVVRADLTAGPASEAGGGAVVLEDLVTGSEYAAAMPDAPIVGVWANGGGIAYSTFQDGAYRLFQVTRAPLGVRELEPGYAPRFVPSGYYFVAQEPGLNADVRFHSTATGTSGSAFFLPGEQAWTNDDSHVWWLDAPSTDPRFDEAPNPTPFVAALYERG